MPPFKGAKDVETWAPRGLLFLNMVFWKVTYCGTKLVKELDAMVFTEYQNLSWNSSHCCFEIRNSYWLRSFLFGAFLIFLFIYFLTFLLLFCLFFVVFFPWWWIPPTINNVSSRWRNRKRPSMSWTRMAMARSPSKRSRRILTVGGSAAAATGWWVGSLPIRKHGCVCFFFKGRGKSLTPHQSAPEKCRCCKKYRKFCLGWNFFYGFSMDCHDRLDWLRDPKERQSSNSPLSTGCGGAPKMTWLSDVLFAAVHVRCKWL